MSTRAVTAFYDRWARAYDWFCRLLPGLGRLRRAAVDALDLDHGDTVVDLGCGTGASLPLLRERVGATGTVVGVDASPGMLGVARRRVARAGWRNVYLVRGDAAQPPLDGVEGVLASFVVGLFSDPAAAVERWVDCLAPVALVAVLEAGPSDHGLARGLNPAFDALVGAGNPFDGDAPSATLDARIEAARRALAARTTLTSDVRRGAGFVRLFAGERAD